MREVYHGPNFLDRPGFPAVEAPERTGPWDIPAMPAPFPFMADDSASRLTTRQWRPGWSGLTARGRGTDEPTWRSAPRGIVSLASRPAISSRRRSRWSTCYARTVRRLSHLGWGGRWGRAFDGRAQWPVRSALRRGSFRRLSGWAAVQAVDWTSSSGVSARTSISSRSRAGTTSAGVRTTRPSGSRSAR
jgi:hypothetical protein